MQQRYLVPQSPGPRAQETVAGKQAQKPPQVMNRQEQPGLVLSTYWMRLTAQLPEVADLSRPVYFYSKTTGRKSKQLSPTRFQSHTGVLGVGSHTKDFIILSPVWGGIPHQRFPPKSRPVWAKAKAKAKCKSKRKSKRKSTGKSKRLSIVSHELDPTPAVGSNPTPGDFWLEIFGVGCLSTPGIKSLVWDPTPRTPVWDWKRA